MNPALLGRPDERKSSSGASFTIQDFDRFEVISHEEGLVVRAVAFVADERESEDSPHLIVHALYSVAQRSMFAARAVGMVLADGTQVLFANWAEQRAAELTAWACSSLELFKRCERRWHQELADR